MREFDTIVLTPAETVFSGKATMIVARAPDGEIAVMAGHAPLVTALAPGLLRIRTGTEMRFVTSGGLLRVSSDGVVVAVEAAERPEDIDLARAEAARERALKRLDEPGRGHVTAEAALSRALVRIAAARRVRQT